MATTILHETMNHDPPLEKTELCGLRLIVGAAASQNQRPYMQDVFSIILHHRLDKGTDILGVFDGHGDNGDKVAQYVSDHLADSIMERLVEGGPSLKAMVRTTFLEVDETLRTDMKDMVSGGTTTVVVFIKEDKLIVAHVGDSRAIMAFSGDRVVALTNDHKPAMPNESERIYDAGGYVYANRVNGQLAVSRSFGDFSFKNEPLLPPNKQKVTADPDVLVVKNNFEFIVLASDGLWDILGNQTVAEVVRRRMRQQWPMQEIAADIVGMVVKNQSPVPHLGLDNVTVLVATSKAFYNELKQSIGQLNKRTTPL